MPALPPHDPPFPKQWADEMARASSTLSSASASPRAPPKPAPAAQPPVDRAFDSQLDAFLHRFQHQILAARDLKHHLDTFQSHDDPAYHAHKRTFKLKMDHIRSLFATEGELFVSTLERRNPNLTMSACGQNTIELAHGIERLQTAVNHEEIKRAAAVAAAAADATVASASAHAADAAAAAVADAAAAHSHTVAVLPSSNPSVTNNLSSEETLQLMQSDINALKLELMRLHRAKAAAAAAAAAPTNAAVLQPSYATAAAAAAAAAAASSSASTHSHTPLPFTSSTVSPDAKCSANAPPIPASILANNSVSIVRVTGRSTTTPSYVSHFELMKSRLQALENKPLSRRAKSAARLGRTQTMGSMYEHEHQLAHTRLADENHNPNVSAMVTPPRASRRHHRSVSTTSPPRSSITALVPTPPPPPLEPLRVDASPSTTPSPVRLGRERTAASPARLYFDAPEDMLSRPQSHAAARDMHRYSLKVSRRFGPSEMDVGADTRVDAMPQRVAETRGEPRAKSAVTVSPNRRRGNMKQGGMSVGNALADTAAAQLGPPSTIDTSGSGGRVVEEIEGDMWVRKGMLWKRWRRRYASIVSHPFFGRAICLFSYDSGGRVISTRSQIVVLANSLCKALREKLEIGGQERFMFVLRTESKEYFFAAETDEIRRNWIRELKDAARKDAGRLLHSTKGRSMAFRKRT